MFELCDSVWFWKRERSFIFILVLFKVFLYIWNRPFYFRSKKIATTLTLLCLNAGSVLLHLFLWCLLQHCSHESCQCINAVGSCCRCSHSSSKSLLWCRLRVYVALGVKLVLLLHISECAELSFPLGSNGFGAWMYIFYIHNIIYLWDLHD